MFWSIRVSIPVPRPCEGRTLPIAPIPCSKTQSWIGFHVTPITMKNKMLQEGLEPPTLGLLDPCSTKLSYQSCSNQRARIPRTDNPRSFQNKK